jgi:hypothetical protein
MRRKATLAFVASHSRMDPPVLLVQRGRHRLERRVHGGPAQKYEVAKLGPHQAMSGDQAASTAAHWLEMHAC